jgi:hypothetical protein
MIEKSGECTGGYYRCNQVKVDEKKDKTDVGKHLSINRKL